MKKHRSLLLCGATGLLALNVAHASSAPSAATASPTSFADLLEPIPNALEALIADDIARARQPKPLLQLAQFHHHHHHGYYYHHHHHHHGYFGGGIVIAPPVYDEPYCYIQRRVVINPYGQRVVRNVRVCE